ncbi:MAG TPA: peptide ABC transporter substrate-binding protein [Cyanobacteria bacterium UBA8553]|nr:peptide ABC transporter substrate-binding protein [Cyanobacteria bacterium UBA8553]
MSVVLTLTLVLTSQFILTSCNPTTFKTKAAQVSQLVLHSISDPKTFNYSLKSEFPNIFPFTFEGLTFANEFTGKIEPALAESWQSFDNNQRYIFTLREGLKWSDGKPLTADDVVFTYEDIVFNPEIATDQKDVLKIGSNRVFPKIRKLDERRVEFTLPEPFAPFLRITSGPQDGVVILPKHILRESVISKDANGNPKFASTWGTDTKPENIVVNGAYRIARYTPGQRLILERNPYYWRKDAQGKPQPYIERIVWQIIESTETALLEFRSGGLDVTDGWGRMPTEYFALLKQEEKRGNFKIHTAEARPGTNFISFNLNKGRRKGRPLVDPIKSRWFNSVEFRQAVAYVIDRQSIINNFLQGLGELQNSPISVQSPYYISAKEGLKVYEYNPERSKELLKKAGFKYNSRGQLLDTDGNQVRFTMLTNAENKTRVGIGSQIKQDLSKIGIQVDFNPIAFNTLVDKLSNTLDWECYLLGFTGGVEPNDGANVWSPDGGMHSFNQKPQQGQPPIEGREVADWEAQIGRLYIEGAREVDEAKRKAIYAETQRITQEYLPMIYLVNALSMSAVRDRIQNVKYSALGGVVWNFYELKVVDK